MMERWPYWPSLVLVCFLTLCPDGETQTAFTIDWVKLTFVPGTTVESGSNLTLRCEAKVSHSSSTLMRNLKLLMDGTVIYSKNTSEAVVEYSLVPARASHSGLYECQVQISKKERRSKEQRLIVTGLQTPQLKVHPRIINEGGEFSATCSAPEETGGLNIYLFSNKEELQVIRSKDNSGTIRVKVHEPGNLTLHCNYILMLNPTAGRSGNSNTVSISVKELAITPSIRISNNTVVEGDRVSIECTVSDYSEDNLELFLTKDTLLYKHNWPFNHSFVVSANDSGEYVCKSEIGDVQKSSKTKLTVLELFTRPSLTVSLQNVFITQPFNLSCKSDINSRTQITSKDMKFSLYKNKKWLADEQVYSTFASRDSTGSYYCEAKAKGITKVSMPLLIQVKVPVSVPEIHTIGTIIMGQPFQLRCESEYGTLPITYTLKKFDRRMAHLTVTGPHRSALFNISSIGNRNESHGFICLAENQGPPQNSLPLNISVVEIVSVPDLTLVTKGNMVTEGATLTLCCSVQHGTFPITFAWYRKGVLKPLRTVRISKTKECHIIKPITRDAEGRYYCQASNDANETRTSVPIHIGVNLAIWKKAIIGASCIFLLVLIIIILVIFKKKAHTPRKTKRAVELSVKPIRTKSNDPMRVSLTLDIEDNTAGNVSPGIMGRNAWSEDVSSSESDEESEKEELVMSQHSDEPPVQNVDSGKELVIHSPDIVKDDFQDITEDETDEVDTDMYVPCNHCELEPEKAPSSLDTPHVIYSASTPAPPACQ